ncbi:MAG TPA: hypothetical protein VN705_10620 [Steroidobacteraceae bacterium]|jgi:hypothetical protein|nr:hypothetical protein [Steroidobacteraceae bacterium]
MLRSIAGLLLSCLIGGAASAQSTDGLAELRWLIGEWRGVGQGDPGTSGSERHNDSFLGGRYIRASGTSVYPKQEKNPSGEVHEQLDLWSYDRARSSVILRTFDTLGFTCTYVLDRAASSADRWVLNGESLENVPKGMKARYIYTRPSENEYHEVLELDTDGKGFKPYVTNRFLKVQSSRS